MTENLTMHCPRAAILMIPWSPFQRPLHLQIDQAQRNLLKTPGTLLGAQAPCPPVSPGTPSYQGVQVLVEVTVKLWETVAAPPGPLLVNLHYSLL